MNVTKVNVDDLNAVLNINVEKTDYEERVKQVLNDYRKKVKLDGFRPGKVPMGLIQKMYYKTALIEEINKLVSESMTKFLINEKLNILGEPIPHKSEGKIIDWDKDTDFEFSFDLGLAPELDITISSKDKLTSYRIKVDEKLIDRYVDSYCQRFGEYEKAENITEKDILKSALIETDKEGNPIPEGIKTEEASLSVEMIKDNAIKKQLLNAKPGEQLIVDLRKAYPNEVEITNLLKSTKEKVADSTGFFQIAIHEVNRFRKANVDQQLFDKIYGKDIIKSEKDFRAKLAEEAQFGLKQDSDYRFRLDAKELLAKKFKKELPREFLKRWLLLINEGKFTEEQIEKEFDHFEEDLKWQLIKDKIVEDHALSVNEEEMKLGAKEYTLMQLRQYGMTQIPDEHLEEFSKRMLEKEEEKKNIARRIIEEKIFNLVKNTAKVDEKEITAEKFNKLFEK